MSDIWSKVQHLRGQALEILTQKKRFSITEIDNNNVYFIPDVGTGTRRWVTWEMLNHIAAQEWAKTDLCPSRIAQEYPSDRNPSYIAAILKSVMKP